MASYKTLIKADIPKSHNKKNPTENSIISKTDKVVFLSVFKSHHLIFLISSIKNLRIFDKIYLLILFEYSF